MRITSVSRPKFETLVSPGPDRNTPIYNWHAFKHSYSRLLVKELIKDFQLKKGSYIMDPFCGGGTTLLTGKHEGMHTVGFDILPFSVFLSNTKLHDYSPESLLRDLMKLKTRLLRSKKISASFPTDIDFLQRAFPASVLKELLRIKTEINKVGLGQNRDFFNLAFLSVLEQASNTTKGGGFLRFNRTAARAEDVLGIFFDQCSSMFADVLQLALDPVRAPGSGKAQLGDARSVKVKTTFDSIITSPPYPNRHDYTRIYALEMAFDFISNNAELKQIRYDTLRSHVEARQKFAAPDYEEPAAISPLIRKIEENGLNNPQVPGMLRGYFEDMHLVIKQMKRHLRSKGRAAIVVSNVRFSGVNVPVDSLLAKIGLGAGFTTANVWTARKRGNSPQQMRDHSRKTSRESLVILTR